MTAPTELLHKLQIQAGTKLWLINVPQDIAEEITAGAEVEPVHEKDAYDGVLAFFDSVAEVEAMAPRILAEMPPDGLLWIAYRTGQAPGQSSGLDEATGWSPLEGAGWNPVRQVALDEDWSAQQFTPEAGKKEGSQFG